MRPQTSFFPFSHGMKQEVRTVLFSADHPADVPVNELEDRQLLLPLVPHLPPITACSRNPRARSVSLIRDTWSSMSVIGVRDFIDSRKGMTLIRLCTQ